MKRIMMLAVITLMFIPGCFLVDDEVAETDNILPYLQLPEPCPDVRFIGKWMYYDHWEDDDGIEETTEYMEYKFENTNRVWYSYSYEQYLISTGWTMHDYSNFYQWKIEGAKLYKKLWDNQFDNWDNGIGFEFITSNRLEVDGKEFEKQEF